jgi:hypothetical protein
MVSVFASNRIDAEIIRSLLEGSGVPAIVQGGSSGAYPVNVGALGEAHVYVHEEDVDRAREIIADAHPEWSDRSEPLYERWATRRIVLITIAAIVLIAFAIGIIIATSLPDP